MEHSAHRSLPGELSPFVGRRDEVEAIAALVARNSLTTLTGPGGSGKTRLALRVAHEIPRAAFFVDLSSVGHGDFVPAAIARELGLRPHPMSAADAVIEQLSGREALLILDNCEQVVDAVAGVCHRLAEDAPTLRMLATSRERLRVPGEAVYAVGGLACPPADAKPEEIEEYDAVRLFVECARRARRDFAVSPLDAAAIAGICRQLDGLPLAIELAGACVRLHSPARIHDGLSERFRLLADGPRTAAPRHQSLRDCIDWSHDLLSDAERSVFRRLGVFVGAFDLSTATAVASGGDVATDVVPRIIGELVDKSLVVAEPGHDRYRLLATLREYAREQLDLRCETERARARHRDAFIAFAESEYPVPWRGRETALSALTPVVDDLLLAFAHADEHDDADAMCRLSTAVMLVLRSIHRQNEAVPIADRVAAALASATPLRRAQLVASWAPWGPGVHPELEPSHAAEAVEIFRVRDDRRSLCLALVAAVNAGANPPGQAHAMAAEAVELGRAEEDPVAETVALWALASLEELEDGDAAAAHMVDAVRSAYRADDALGHSAQWRLIKLQARQGRHREALDEIHALMARPDEGGSSRWRAHSHVVVAAAHLGDVAMVGSEAERARHVLSRRRPRVSGPDVLDSLIALAQALAAHLEGDLRTAQRHYADAQAMVRTEVEADYAFRTILVWQCWCQLGLGDADGAARTAASLWARPFGGPLELDLAPLVGAMSARERGEDRAAEALTHELLPAAVSARRDDVVATLLELLAGMRESGHEAARLLGAAQSLRDARGSVLRLPPHDRRHADDLARVHDAIGPQAFAAAWAEGAALDPVAAVAYARRGRGARGRPGAGWGSLTPAERTVVDLVASGLSNQQVADRLYVSARTVASHLRRIFAKLGVGSRTELTRLALTESSRTA